MLVIKLLTIAACWLHAGLHDRATGYASFFCIIILSFLYERHKTHDPQHKPSMLSNVLNIVVGFSVVIFFIALYFEKTSEV